MKLDDRENIHSLFRLMPCILFFCSYFFPYTAIILTALWHFYLAADRFHLKINRMLILFSVFISISGYAIRERDSSFETVLFINSVPAPAKIDSYKKGLGNITAGLKNIEFMTALTTGERLFSDSFRNDLVNTGTMHIVAISAFHVGLMLIMINFILKISGISLFLTPRYFTVFSLVVKLFLSFYYFFITGSSIPTLRALLFMLIFDFYILTGKNPHLLTIFVYSITAVCIVIPASVTSISFIMSALCVSAIINIWGILPRSVTVKLISVSVMMNYILIPVSASLNGTFPLFSPFVNLLVIPVISISLPFISMAQFIAPVSMIFSAKLLQIADFLISPASFLVVFFGDVSEKLLLPVIDPPFSVKIIFVCTFFCVLFAKKRKIFFIILNILFLIPFQMNFFESTARPEIFYGKVFCIKESSEKGHMIFDKYRNNPFTGISLSQKIEKGAADCGIRKLVSIHFPQEINRQTVKNLRKRLRMRSVRIYTVKEDLFYGSAHYYEPSGRDHDHIP